MQIEFETPVLQDETRTGKNKYWQGVVLRDGDRIFTASRFWQEGSAPQESAPTEIFGKNVGRSNETTPLEQARKDIQSDFDKKRKKGYDELGKPRAVREFIKPMLAHRYDKYPEKMSWPCFVQPKLDGIRCLTDGVRFWTRNAEEFPAECVKHLQCDTGGRIVDGELMLPHAHPRVTDDAIDEEFVRENVSEALQGRRYSFNQTASACKKFDYVLTPRLRLNVYDIADPTLTYQGRLAAILELFSGAVPVNWLPVETKFVQSEEEAREWYGRFMEAGYEGAMLRSVSGCYEIDVRSYSLLKLKQMQDAEFKLKGIKEGKGNDKGTAILECLTGKGKEFTVRPEGTHAERARILRDAEQILRDDPPVTVTFQEYTPDGKPRFPVRARFRNYE
jgi:DNA ligase-1